MHSGDMIPNEMKPHELAPKSRFWRRFRCPSCSFQMQRKDLRLVGTFDCPRCHQALTVSTTYARNIGRASVFLACMLALSFQRGWAWVAVAIVLYWPVGMTLQLLVPPKVLIAPAAEATPVFYRHLSE